MWREIAEQFPGAGLCEPTTLDSLMDIGKQLGQSIPQSLQEFLLESDGMVTKYGVDTIWKAERILAENVMFRSDEQFRSLYMPFDPLIFFGDNGGGDNFAFVRTPERDDVFVWDHETDSRSWISASLEGFLRSFLESDGEDWYR
ncbi:SMI1/KNR4 family protein [Streptomyces sp. NPDC048442]|uniref:SMI1/KNR4 family protein n=1 Tax=Streptomyces sp. NPDC048442 TaxID=3154823 RepID=UPI00343817B3